ncbi:putative N-acetylmannosamine-6-phosphate 2-epimerase [Pleomorphomonas koreensis]|uniref:putative N-acetylmannosamine-6-phosphate 2-epimerase n=1 Tax=Pleomorphomonas koreensis TaxID=257440 RepID=UPI00047984F5|nr:putative N-acetylmannosamine-6-phosphate 2-epimerase [Pleomorphomonas koreensis]
MSDRLQRFASSLVVSCQPVPDGPLDHPEQVVGFALAALASGGRGLRIEGLANLRAVRAATDAPIIGLIKRDLDDSPVRITPFLDDVRALAEAGADIIAFDATDRARPAAVADLCAAAHAHGRLAMADISTIEEAKAAVALGVDVIGTTLSGYTGGPEPDDPDFPLLAAAVRLGRPVIAEGRIRVPEQAAEAIRLGAHGVVVGSAITRPEHITRWFADAIATARAAATRPALAFDLGGTKTLVALVDGDRVVEETERATLRHLDPDAWCDAIAELAAPWQGRYGAIGGAVTGVVHAGRWSALNPGTLPVPDGYPLADALARRLGQPVTLNNDAQAAAWGEYRFGAGAGRDLVFVTVSTGIGGGAVIGGRLLIGRGGVAGSVGLTLEAAADGAMPLETLASGRFLAEAAAKAGHLADAPAVFAAAARGESWASALVDRSADVVARLLQNLQLLFDPAVMVVGGGVGLAGGYRERLNARLSHLPPHLKPEIRAAALGKTAGVIGAADLARRTS